MVKKKVGQQSGFEGKCLKSLILAHDDGRRKPTPTCGLERERPAIKLINWSAYF